MGDISKNFSRSEFCCKCCDFSTVDVKLIEVLEIVRSQFKKPVKITSACRCEEYNYVVGGADSSKHKLGIAADIIVKDVDPVTSPVCVALVILALLAATSVAISIPSTVPDILATSGLGEFTSLGVFSTLASRFKIYLTSF